MRTDYEFPDVETAAEVCGPFFGDELVARIRAALRRAPGEEEDANAEVVEVADVRLELAQPV